MIAASFTHPVERKPAHTVPLAPPVTPKVESKWIALAQIEPSPFNPRKDFPKDELAELAASIQARGLLENLVVRPHPKKKDHFELMGGERRFRALKLNKAEGAQCNVIAADDGEALATQIVENMEREDLTPLEEAEAFVALQKQDPKRWSAAAIGRAIGKTDSFVIQRMRLTRLAPPLRKAMENGELGIEAARAIASVPPALQERLGYDRYDLADLDAEQVRSDIAENAVPVAKAQFDIKLYDGEILKDGKKELFLDVDKFVKLQQPAALKKVEALKAEWPTAKLVTLDEATKWHWADQTYSYGNSVVDGQRKGNEPSKYVVAKDKCTAIVFIDAGGDIRTCQGVCSAAAINARSNSRSASGYSYKPPKPESSAHRTARNAFNKKLTAAASKAKDFPPRFALHQIVVNGGGWQERQAMAKALPAGVKKAFSGYGEAREIAIWEAIAELTDAQVRDTQAKCAQALVPQWGSYSWKTLPRFMLTLATSLGIDKPVMPKPVEKKAKKKAAKAKSRKHA